MQKCLAIYWLCYFYYNMCNLFLEICQLAKTFTFFYTLEDIPIHIHTFHLAEVLVCLIKLLSHACLTLQV